MKKPIIIASAIVIIGLVATGIFVFRDKIFKKTTTTTPQTMEDAKKETDLWEDPAGFSFQYPKGIAIDKHDEDTENYAHLELTDVAHGGRLIVWGKDTLYKDVDTWVKKDLSLKDAAIIDTTLGGKPAKKMVVTNPARKLITGAIDEEMIVTIEAEPIEGDVFWQEVYDTIIQSFAFISIEGQETTSDDYFVEDTGPVIDEEEVLE